jgi:O-antigen/teichoic acid export membrane protein
MSFDSTSGTSARLRTVAFNSLANFLFPLTTLITGPLLARTLGPSGRGLMAALLAPLALANLMFTLGVPEALTYFVARGRLTNKKALQIAVGGALLCAAVVCSVLLIAAPYLFHKQARSLPAFKLLLITLPVTLAFSGIRGIASGHQLFGLINKEQIFAALLRLSLLLGFVLFHALTPLNAVWLSVISGALGSLFLLPVLRSAGPSPANVQDTQTVARYAGSVALGTFGGLIVIRLDQVLMVSLTTNSQLAYYSVAASLAELPLVVVAAIRDLAFSLTAERNDPKIIARSCRLTVVAIGVMCLAAGLTTPFVVPLLFGTKFAPAAWMVEVLLLGTLGRAVTTVIGAGLMTTGRTFLRSAIQLGGAVITAVLLFALVPVWGGMGAAWVTTLTYTVLAFSSVLAYVQAAGLSVKQCVVPTASDIRDLKSAIVANVQRARVTPGS